MGSKFNAQAVRDAIEKRGMSLTGAATAMSYNVAYLSRVLAGKQQPSRKFLAALDAVLSTPAEESRELSYRAQFDALLRHDSRFGGDHVASAGLQVWRAEQYVLDRTADPEPGVVSAVAEMAEVAGWLCYSAGRFDESRQAFAESLTLARHSADLGMQWFATDMLAMVAVTQDKPGEAIRLSEASLDLSAHVPGRVAVMARVRRARALALAGDRTRSWTEMSAALSGIDGSLSDSDPAWTWWITPAELAGHKGEMMLSLGQPGEAVECFRRAIAGTPAKRARAALSYRVAEFHALIDSHAWEDAGAAIEGLAPVLATVSSRMTRLRLADAMRAVRKSAPDWLVDTSRDVLSSTQAGL